ncbi:phosphodiester glycosidase family protein [Chamaesiphon sp. OTE_20_metabat_361]|uniref:phosphodiester glycosidase family protein n=1 Tax=Chamaesiphon sp. OTE_20_metabat_361 TaxID=2964689 RepID=UPI00286AF893|nr:phosphodiester glycosidase family protein [Chamaesiphon sp. OTE_20_metabat_361]
MTQLKISSIDFQNFMNDRSNFHSIWHSPRYIFFLFPLALLTSCDRAVTQTTSPTFQESIVAPGITIRTNVAQKTYVIEADLSKTTLRSISGAPTPAGKVGQMKFEEFWAQNNNNGALKVLINGTFFQTYNKPTGIAFGLKQDKQLITYGYGLNEFPNQTVTVAWSDGKISIEPYSLSTFNGTTPNVVGALAPTAGKNASRALPRTFIGVKNQLSDKTYSTVLLFISPAASQSEAEQTLQKFGAERVAMLDGGQSTGLIIGGKSMLQPKTRIPQTIGIFIK